VSEVSGQEWRIGMRSESTDATYVINVMRKAKEVRFECSCQAGSLGKLCKHILSIVNDDTSRLSQSNQESEVHNIFEAFRSTETYPLLLEYQTAGMEKEKIERRLTDLKKVLAKKLLR
jgi:hypothetical protein